MIEIIGTTIKQAGKTRWRNQADAVKLLHTKFTKIIALLEQLMEDAENATTKSNTVLIIQAMLLFHLLTFLGLWRAIVSEIDEIDDTQKYLQGKGLQLQQCAIKQSALKTSL